VHARTGSRNLNVAVFVCVRMRDVRVCTRVPRTRSQTYAGAGGDELKTSQKYHAHPMTEVAG